jgi:ribonuclease HI
VKYVAENAAKWLEGWKKANWVKKDGKPVKNQDLWEELYKLTWKNAVKWEWVKGHTGHPENERCDQLAKEAAGRLKKEEGI